MPIKRPFIKKKKGKKKEKRGGLTEREKEERVESLERELCKYEILWIEKYR